MRGRQLRSSFWTATIAILVAWFLAGYFVEALPMAIRDFGSSILLIIFLTAMYLLKRTQFLSFQLDRSVPFAVAAGAIFVILSYEPAFTVGHSYRSPGILLAASGVIYNLLFAFFLQAFLFGPELTAAIRHGNTRAINMPFILYILLSLQLDTIAGLIQENQAQILFFAIQFIGGIILFFILFIIFVKSRFNNLPGIIFYLLYAVPGLVVLQYRSSTFLYMLWPLIDFAAVLLFLEVLMPDNRYVRRLFGPGRKIKRKLNIVRTVIAIASIAVVLSGIFVVAPIMAGTQHPFYTDPTGSMVPVISPDSLLIVRGINASAIHVGQILVFQAPWNANLTVAHRVISITDNQGQLFFQTKGIANPYQDPLPVPAHDVRGVVVYAVPYLGYLFVYSYLVISVILIATVIAVTVRLQ